MAGVPLGIRFASGLLHFVHQAESIRNQPAGDCVPDRVTGESFSPAVGIDVKTDDHGGLTIPGIYKIEQNGLLHLVMDVGHQPIIHDQYGEPLEVSELSLVPFPVMFVRFVQLVEKLVHIEIVRSMQIVACLDTEGLGEKGLSGSGGPENAEVLLVRDEIIGDQLGEHSA